MTEIILYIGLGIFIIGGIGLLIAAFKTGALWGLAVLLIPPVAIFYVIAHWQDAKGSFLTQVSGFIVMVLSAYLNGGHINIPTSVSSVLPSSSATSGQHIKCDGRQYCSQMRSRAEAEFFLKNCPNTKMDGDHDGIPCENDSRF